MTFMSDSRDDRVAVRMIASALTAVGSVQAACRASAEYEALAALSDAELDARGLSRETLCETVLARYL